MSYRHPITVDRLQALVTKSRELGMVDYMVVIEPSDVAMQDRAPVMDWMREYAKNVQRPEVRVAMEKQVAWLEKYWGVHPSLSQEKQHE